MSPKQGSHHENTGLYKGDMLAADLVSPTNEVQIQILKQYYEAIPKLKSNKAKSTLSYYIFNDLHLFEDGNGRLSRFMYQMFDGTFDEDFILHNDNDIAIKSYEMESEKNILDIDSVNFWANYITFKLLLKNGIITNDKRFDNFETIKTFGNSGFVLDHSSNQVSIPEDIKQQLGSDEVNRFIRNITNNNGNITNAGISMCIILSRLNTIESALNKNDMNISALQQTSKIGDINFSKRLVFRIGDNKPEDVKINFSEWTVDTYKEFNQVSETLHKQQLETLIDMFVRPKEYMWNETETFLGKITNEEYCVNGYDTTVVKYKNKQLSEDSNRVISLVEHFNDEPKPILNIPNAKINIAKKIATIFMSENNTYVGHATVVIYEDGTANMDMSRLHNLPLPTDLDSLRQQLQSISDVDVALYTNPSFRKQGVAKSLIEQILKYLNTQSIEILKVSSISSDAKKLYGDTGATYVNDNIAYYNDISRLVEQTNAKSNVGKSL